MTTKSAHADEGKEQRQGLTPVVPELGPVTDDAASGVVDTAREPGVGGSGDGMKEVAVNDVGGEVGKDLALVGTLLLGGMGDLVGVLEVGGPGGGSGGEIVVPEEGDKSMSGTLSIHEAKGSLKVRGDGSAHDNADGHGEGLDGDLGEHLEGWTWK